MKIVSLKTQIVLKNLAVRTIFTRAKAYFCKKLIFYTKNLVMSAKSYIFATLKTVRV